MKHGWVKPTIGYSFDVVDKEWKLSKSEKGRLSMRGQAVFLCIHTKER